MSAKAICPVCGITLLTLEESSRWNRLAAENGTLYNKYDTAGYRFTHMGKCLCHVCSEEYKSVMKYPKMQEAQAEMNAMLAEANDMVWQAEVMRARVDPYLKGMSA